jgi:hypothetical protein
MIGGDQLAASIRSATGEAAKTAIEGFGAAAILALGDVMAASVKDRAAIGADAVAQTLVEAFATDLAGRIVTEVDANGIKVGDLHVTTQLAKFASGAHAGSPVDDVSAKHSFPFALGEVAGLEASGTLTLNASCALDPATDELKTKAWGKIELALAWSSEGKKEAAKA